MGDCSAGVVENQANLMTLNGKLGYDAAAELQHAGLEDNQSNARAWASFNLEAARDGQRIKHLAELGLLQAGQTGMTENQQTVSPIRTGAGDAIAAVPGVSAGAVAAAIANLATAMVPVNAEIAANLAATVAALSAVLVTATGGASTPSQTQPKPATATS